MTTTNKYLLSSFNTALTTAIVTLGIQLSGGAPIQWTATFWLTVFMVVGRAVVKAVVEGLAGQTADPSAV